MFPQTLRLCYRTSHLNSRQNRFSGIAEDEISKAPAALKTRDENGDGKLSAVELPERMRGIVALADTDKDGFATGDELTKTLAVQSTDRPGGD